MVKISTSMKSFSVEKGTAGKGSGGKTTIIKQNGGNNSGSGQTYDVFQGATETNPGTSGLVPQPLAGQHQLFLKGNGIWDKVFQYIREDSDGNIYIDGKATKFGCPIYLNDIWSRDQDKENPTIEIHDNVIFDKDEEFLGDVSVGGNSDFLGEARFSDDVWFNRTNPKDGTTNKVTVNADLEVNGKSNFTDDMTATNITVDYLTVTKLAHFFELVIDKIRASQGQIIITDANAKIDHVEETDSTTKLYWRADSENQSNLALNEFTAGDQIVCQTFNRGQMEKDEDGNYHGYNVSNKYYWVVVSETGQGEEHSFSDVDDGTKHVFNYVSVSNSDEVSPKDGAFLPEVGDEIVQLGNRIDKTRQAAIVISAYNNTYLDKGIKSPAIVQYDGIDDFFLENHRLNIISKGFNKFTGSYLTEDGQTNIVDKIGDLETTTTNRFSEIQQTIDGITTTVSNQQTTIDTISGQVQENTTNISKLNQTADSISATVKKNTERIEEVSKVADGALTDANISDLRQQVTTNTENIGKLTIKADNINSTVEKHETKITKIGTDLGTTNENVSSLTKTVTDNKSEIDQRADKIELNVSSNKTEIDELTGQVTSNTSAISSIKQTADSITTRVTTIEGDYVTSSQLTQTSTEILAEVSNTYLKIEDGKVIINAAIADSDLQDQVNRIKKGEIELNGNTTISGNLTVKDSDTGFTLIGATGNTKIISKDIGNFLDYVKNPTTYWQTENPSGSMSMVQVGSSYKERFESDNTSKNQYINIEKDVQITINNFDSVWSSQDNYYMGFYPQIINDTANKRVTVKTPDNQTFIQFTYTGFDRIVTLTDKDTNSLLGTWTNPSIINYTPTKTGQAKLRVQTYCTVDRWETYKTSFTYNNKKYTMAESSKVNVTDWTLPVTWCYFTYASTSNVVQNIIGYNGQVFQFGSDSAVVFGTKGFQVKYGDYCFMINKERIMNTEGGVVKENFSPGIWDVNKYSFTQQTGPFPNTIETAKSYFITTGRTFGGRNVRAIENSGKIVVLPEDDILVLNTFGTTETNISVEIYFTPPNTNTYIGHVVTIIHNQYANANIRTSITVKTSSADYPIYTNSGNTIQSYNMGYEIKNFYANYGCVGWVMS